jgi:hypothetical protein
MKKLTKEQKQKQLLKWAKEIAPWHRENKDLIAKVAIEAGKPVPKPPPEG